MVKRKMISTEYKNKLSAELVGGISLVGILSFLGSKIFLQAWHMKSLLT